mgnify:CR=1 FL=1
MRRERISIVWVVVSLCLMGWSSGCLDEGETLPGGSATPTETPWIEIYFTNPKSPTAASYRGGPDKTLAEAIDQARLSVDMAAYDLNLWSLRDALLRAAKRGVTVRMVTDSDNLDEPEIQDLIDANIPVLGDRREGLMHNKFVVIDRAEVWTGSMNFTTSEAYLNNNNLVRIRSTRLAENYTTEFNEMFEDDLFGPAVRCQTPHPQLEINGITLETYFSPDDGAARRLVALIQQAEQSLYFLAYSFTADDLADAMIERANAGVVVAGVMEETQVQSNVGSDYERLRQAGLDIRLDGNPRNMHHKVMIIDEAIVVTGSYNFSASAEKYNDENTLVIHDAAATAQFLAEFKEIYKDGHR